MQYFYYRTYFSITTAYNTSITERTSVLQLYTILPFAERTSVLQLHTILLLQNVLQYYSRM